MTGGHPRISWAISVAELNRRVLQRDQAGVLMAYENLLYNLSYVKYRTCLEYVIGNVCHN